LKKKFYVSDGKYEKFLKDLQYLIDNKNDYFAAASIIYDEIRELIIPMPHK